MSRSIEEIVMLLHERKKMRAPELSKALEVRDQYNGDIVVPLPELDRNERAALPDLLRQGLDQNSMRIASTQPNVYYPPVRPGIKRSQELARNRRLCTLAWWTQNRMKLKDRRRARHLVGYASSPVYLRPDFDRNIPSWHVRNPLCTFPATSDDPDDITPEDCITIYHRPLSWLRRQYPNAANLIYKGPKGNDTDQDELFELVEYTDAQICVVGLLGKQRSPWDHISPGADVLELERYANLANICTAVVPGRITLDRPMGQYDGMLGMFMQMAKLQALSVIATEKGIFADDWLVARPGEIPKIIAQADGRLGQTGVVQGGILEHVKMDPSFMTPQQIDRLERYQRLEGGIPAEYGGESATNVRTGRRGDSILSAVVDFPIQEAQELLAASREEENKRAIAIDRAWFNRQKTFFFSWKGAKNYIEYVPGDLWENDENYVSYSHAGVDVNGLTIEIGQHVGMELVSKRYGMNLHPMVEDPERMHDEIIVEGLERAMLQGLQQQASQPGSNVADYARIMQLVATDKAELADAIIQVQKEAQQRQASIDAQGNPDVVLPGSPEAQPGMAAPGQGAEAAVAAIQPPAPSQTNFQYLLHSLRQPQSQTAAEQSMVMT